MTAQQEIPKSAESTSPDARDRELIARVLGGERELFHELVRPYEKSIYFAAYSLLQNEPDAEDAAQEAVLKALKNLHTFRAEAKFSTWLVSIALNEARGRLRHNRLIEFQSVDAVPEDDTADFTPAVISDWREVPSDALERKEVRELLQCAIQKLPAMYREVLLLRDVQDFNIAETAATLGVREGVVKTRLLRARLMMQKELAPKLNTGRKGLLGVFQRQARGSWF